MKKTRFQRTTALLLTFAMLVGGAVTASAAGSNSSVTDSTIASMKDLLGTISYEEYCSKHYKKDKDGNNVLDENNNPIWTVDRATSDIVVDCLKHDAAGTTAEGVEVREYDGQKGLYLPESGSVSWKVQVPTSARYTIQIEYYPVEAKNTAIQRIFKINNEVLFTEARYLTMTKVYKSSVTEKYTTEDGMERYFKKDAYGNELRPNMTQSPEWRTYTFRDSDGFNSTPFEFAMPSGEVMLTLDAVSEPVVIKSITLCAPRENASYEEVRKNYEGLSKGTDTVIIQAETPAATSSQTIYPVEDRSSALTQPCSTKVQLLNTIGGEKWAVAGQWIRYEFTVNNSGLYEIAARFRQNVLDGIYSSRALYIYSGEGVSEGEVGYYNGLPFAEATQIRFGYDDKWQTDRFFYMDDDGTRHDLEFYFKEGVTYTIEMEVTLGDMGDIVSRVQDSLSKINNAYLNIIKLTGTSPDAYRDYGFYRVMPETMIQMIVQSRNLYKISKELTTLTGEKSSNAATLDKVAWLLNEMGTSEDNVARNLDRLKSYIGTLGTWVSDAKTQPLQLDYLVIQGAQEQLPKANASFWQSFVHEVSSFIQSFFRDYNHMGAVADSAASEKSLEVWLAYGRDQSQVIRNLINNYFTPSTGIAVDLKLVAGGTLLPSILAKRGPDVYIGIGQGDIINYAIRGALDSIEGHDDFYDIALNPATREFNDAAMLVLGIEDAQGQRHYYGLPETQDFPMMFVRTDILANLNIEIPKTWDDVLEALPKLQANNMEIGLSADANVYLYQMGGTLFADDGMRINLDSNVGLEAFTMMCDMYTMYSFPYSYNFSNRFRTGEMPIGIGSYTGTYNTLVVFATEIRGLWQFFPLPGIQDENGNINNASVSSCSAVCMIAGTDMAKEAWEFMKWQTGADCQAKYSNEMIAILGDSAKHPTANMKAFDSLTWTQSELTEIKKQFANLASVPNYPGAYIVSRYTSFAFLAAYNDMADPSNELLSYIDTINKEITRKRKEFGLEVLEGSDTTLAAKRLREAQELLEATGDSNAAVTEALQVIADAPAGIKSGVETEYLDRIKNATTALQNTDAAKYQTIIGKLTDAINAMISYNIYY